jgi:hypothetical protein
MHLAYRNFEPSPLNMRYTATDGHLMYPAAQQPRRKVCIYGAGLYRDEAPLEDPEWEVWALNLVAPLDRQGRLRCDRWFDIHQRCAQTEDDLRWIAKCPVAIYVPPDLKDASPNAVAYPLDFVERQFGPNWACTFAYQIALVLAERAATDIGLYGVELAYGTARERTVEWACTSYWIGRAEERGLNIHLPERSLLGRHFARYGFEYARELELTKRYTDSMKQADQAREDMQAERDQDEALARAGR